MAALATTTATAAETSVVGLEYCSAQPVQLVIKIKAFSRRDQFEITNGNSNQLLFKVKAKPFWLRDNRIILDAAGVPILTVTRKVWSGTWQVLRGESSDPSHLICNVKPSSAFFKTKLKVHLAYNTTKQLCDFNLVGNIGGKSWVVYAGESDSAVVAQIHLKRGFLEGEFMVTVSPHIDHAFIASIILILIRVVSGK